MTRHDLTYKADTQKIKISLLKIIIIKAALWKTHIHTETWVEFEEANAYDI
jgi:hypothetical protein